jgi:hypothetical protein
VYKAAKSGSKWNATPGPSKVSSTSQKPRPVPHQIYIPNSSIIPTANSTGEPATQQGWCEGGGCIVQMGMSYTLNIYITLSRFFQGPTTCSQKNTKKTSLWNRLFTPFPHILLATFELVDWTFGQYICPPLSYLSHAAISSEFTTDNHLSLWLVCLAWSGLDSWTFGCFITVVLHISWLTLSLIMDWPVIWTY